MDENGMNQIVGHKRIREQAEEDEEEFMLLFMGVLLVLIGSHYRRKQSLKCSSSASGFREERIYARGVFLRSFEIKSVCLGQLRMPTRVFDKLCSILCEDGGLVPTRNVTIGEMVTIFLYILGHGFKNSNVKEILARSGETISRQFHSVLLAVLKIGNKFIKQDYTSSEGSDSSKWKWFKGVVGALDGTHVPLTVPSSSCILPDNPQASGYKNTVIDNWDDIVMLCGVDKATGSNAENFEEAVGAMIEEEVEVNSSPSTQAPSTSNTSTKEGKGKKRRRNDPLSDVIGELAATMKEYLVAKKAQAQQQSSAQEIHSEVAKVVGLSQFEIFKATQRLMSGNPKEFELLKSLPDDKKSDWIMFLLDPNN